MMVTVVSDRTALTEMIHAKSHENGTGQALWRVSIPSEPPPLAPIHGAAVVGKGMGIPLVSWCEREQCVSYRSILER